MEQQRKYDGIVVGAVRPLPSQEQMDHWQTMAESHGIPIISYR